MSNEAFLIIVYDKDLTFWERYRVLRYLVKKFRKAL